MQLVRALILVGLAASWAAQAQVTEIYKCVQPNGRSLYTSDKRETSGKKCELVSRQVNVVPGSKSQSPAGFPKESAAQRSSARERQRDILQRELATEEDLLDKASKDLSAQDAVRTGEERNYALVEERLQPFKDIVDTHQKNIEALRRELRNLER